ncbi:MAG: hypothetical protein Aureis2KO_01540 [Aureisphaera sp.]
MNKLTVASVLFLIVAYTGQAQDTIYFSDGSFIEGSVIQLQKSKVYFENSDTGERKWYKKKIKRLIDDTDGNKIEYRIREIKGLRNVFSGELIKGKVSYYVTVKYNAASRSYASSYYLLKEDGKMVKDLPNSLTTPFVKRMSKFFSDCPSLVKKIKNKEYTYRDTIEAVKFYNSRCFK